MSGYQRMHNHGHGGHHHHHGHGGHHHHGGHKHHGGGHHHHHGGHNHHHHGHKHHHHHAHHPTPVFPKHHHHHHHRPGPYVVEETVVYQPRAQETVYVERNPRAEEDLCCGIALASLLCCCLGAATN